MLQGLADVLGQAGDRFDLGLDRRRHGIGFGQGAIDECRRGDCIDGRGQLRGVRRASATGSPSVPRKSSASALVSARNCASEAPYSGWVWLTTRSVGCAEADGSARCAVPSASSLATVWPGLRRPTCSRTSSRRASGGHSAWVVTNTGRCVAQALSISAAPPPLTIGQPSASNTAWLVTRSGSAARPWTMTDRPWRASRPASSGVKLGNLRAPLYEGSQTTGRALRPTAAVKAGSMCACAAARNPASSVGLSPLMRIAITKAPSCRSLTRPSKIWRIRSSACAESSARAPSLPRPISFR